MGYYGSGFDWIINIFRGGTIVSIAIFFGVLLIALLLKWLFWFTIVKAGVRSALKKTKREEMRMQQYNNMPPQRPVMPQQPMHMQQPQMMQQTPPGQYPNR